MWILVVAFFASGAGDIGNHPVEFESYESCVEAAEMVVDSYAGETASRLSAFCVPGDA